MGVTGNVTQRRSAVCPAVGTALVVGPVLPHCHVHSHHTLIQEEGLFSGERAREEEVMTVVVVKEEEEELGEKTKKKQQ